MSDDRSDLGAAHAEFLRGLHDQCSRSPIAGAEVRSRATRAARLISDKIACAEAGKEHAVPAESIRDLAVAYHAIATVWRFVPERVISGDVTPFDVLRIAIRVLCYALARPELAEMVGALPPGFGDDPGCN